MEKKILEMRQIDKSFPGVHALKKVDFSVEKGEIHGLMGENGAGKSTLIKILTGIYTKDSGGIYLEGRRISPSSPLEAQREGISTIYQEINLVPNLTVAENIFLGRQPRKRSGIDRKAMEKQAEKLIEGLGVRMDVRIPAGRLSMPMQQMAAMARAMSLQAKVMVIDEATSSLDEKEVDIFFKVLRHLKNQGISIIFISHRLNEIYEICDTLTVLKDGELVGRYETSKISKLELVSKMIGRDAGTMAGIRRERNKKLDSAETILKLDQVSTRDKLKNISFEMRRGEIVGLAGLLGAGRTEIAKVIFGEDIHYTGNIEINGKRIKFRQPADAIREGIAYCSENRASEGILPDMNVRENLTSAILPQLCKGGVVQKGRQAKLTEGYIKEMNIKTPSQEQAIKYLSGGNQQKVILSKWICMKPRFIILDEPTRGIDVGAKAEIEKIIQKLAEEGIAILFISSELDELIRNCDRIIVIRDGQKMGELSNSEECTEERILRLIARGNGEQN